LSTYSHQEPLDDEQREVVEATEKAISVLAGPGSGKTRTLAHRARHLLLGDREANALLLTFTNKAAAEMKSRALDVGDIEAERLEATTFHGFGANFLRSHGNLVGIEDEFEILDIPERNNLAASVARGLEIPNQIDTWSNVRRRRLEPGAALEVFGEAFEDAKRAEGLVDFDDLVVYPAEILGEREDVAGAYGARYQHILLDEFQDTNPAQFAIVSALAPHAATVGVFADDDQAIMRFTGAEAQNVERFSEELGAKRYPLSRNYRCREVIVNCANRLITSDPEASGREMRAVKSGGEIEVRCHANETEEARAIGAEIGALIDEEGVSPSAIAVLTRGGRRVDNLVEALSQLSVPLTDWRGALYESEERRLFVTCFATVRAQLRSRHLERLSELIEGEAIEESDTHKFLQAHGDNPVAIELLALRETAFAGGRPSEVAAHAQAAIAAADPEAGERAAVMVEAIDDFERYDPNFSLDKLLSELALNRGGQSPTEGGGVKIATLHGTKGLQWPIVYLVGLEEGRLPNNNAIEDGSIPDERRACFVGVCRAEDRVILTRMQRYLRFSQQPSRFLAEMGLDA
jgi:ATP-dependent DNA helicase UvrD/PcrA